VRTIVNPLTRRRQNNNQGRYDAALKHSNSGHGLGDIHDHGPNGGGDPNHDPDAPTLNPSANGSANGCANLPRRQSPSGGDCATGYAPNILPSEPRRR
jgi:hypothetical protein